METLINNETEKNEMHDLKNRKKQAKLLMENFLFSKEKDKKTLDKITSLDNTLPDIYQYKLQNSDDIELKERSFDILDKVSLFKYNIKKKFNFKDLYFDLNNYIESVNLDEPDDANEKFELEDFEEDEDCENDEDEENENSENNQSRKTNEIEGNEISLNNNKIDDKSTLNVEFKENNDLDENLSDFEFENALEKKMNFDIKNILIKNEKIKEENIKIKFHQIYDGRFSFLIYKNNYPDFESELFYFNCLRYMLETFKSLKKKRFICKIQLTQNISSLTKRIINNQVNDNLIKVLYYFIMNSQYYLEPNYLKLLIMKSENFISDEYLIMNNNLYKKDNEKEVIIENVDNYLINDIIKNDILLSKNKKNLIKNYYSLKGFLNNIDFKKEDGDKFWDEFLSSKILDDIVKKLFNKENIFKQKEIIEQFKERSYYFPNFNTSFPALSHKELFIMYFPPSQVEAPENLNNSFIVDMINKAVNKIKIQHEWGHTGSSFLFFTSKIKYFTTPKRTIKFQNEKSDNNGEKNTREGGKAVEILLYGRVIDDINLKEAIFILNNNNYNLPLIEFQKKFRQLENEDLYQIFEKASLDKETDDVVKKAFKEFLSKGNDIQKILNYHSFKVKEKRKNKIDFDKLIFKLGKNYHYKRPGSLKQKKNQKKK